MASTRSLRSLPPTTHIRAFSTTPRPHRAHTTKPHNLLAPGTPSPPPYPYPSPQWYKQQRLGLYGGHTIRFGHNVSERNEIKTLRRWHPNIQRKRLYSPALDRHIRVRVATRVLRTIDKCGGLDAYLLGNGAARIKEIGEWGWKLRWAVLNAESMRGRLEREPELRRMLGLDEEAVMNPVVASEVVVEEGVDAERVMEEERLEAEEESVDERLEREKEEHVERLLQARKIGHMAEEPEPSKGGFMERVRAMVPNPFKRR